MDQFATLSQNLDDPSRIVADEHPDLDTFLSLPTAQVAQIVQKAESRVCVCPIDGTRRWFLLERSSDDSQGYLDAMVQCLT